MHVNADKLLCLKLSALCDDLLAKTDELDECVSACPSEVESAAFYAADKIIVKMEEAREISDELEKMTDKSFWPIPTYSEILFYV